MPKLQITGAAFRGGPARCGVPRINPVSADRGEAEEAENAAAQVALLKYLA